MQQYVLFALIEGKWERMGAVEAESVADAYAKILETAALPVGCRNRPIALMLAAEVARKDQLDQISLTLQPDPK